MSKPSPWTHVYDKAKNNKYVGFFLNEGDAKAWVKRQKNKKDLEVSNQRPERKPTEGTIANTVDQGLDAAIAAAKSAKGADDAVPTTGEVG